MKRHATISPCGTYRYTLHREWESGHGHLECGLIHFIMLNPSTADAMQDDPTIRRCVGFARRFGFGELLVTNLFALRSTDPRALAKAQDPIGPENDYHIRAGALDSMVTVCAWGTHGRLRGRDQAVLKLLRETNTRPMALRLTKGGIPAHPLYLPGNLELVGADDGN